MPLLQKSAYKLIISLGFLCLLFSCSKSQNVIDDQEVIIDQSSDAISFTTFSRIAPAIMVKPRDVDSSRALKMSDLDIKVEVVGNIATTTFSMTFYNELDRILEGQLYFPLGEGKTVSRFAMDVNGKLREGVIVEKAKGRAIFESIVRKNIDPGLVEWTKGNNFKTRVYPIPSKGHKKVVFAYEQELLNGNDQSIFVLPLGFKEEIENFNIKVEVFNKQHSPDLKHNELSNFSFKKWKENFVAEAKFKNYIANKQVIFGIPKTEYSQEVYTEKGDKGGYFYINLNSQSLLKEKPKVSSISILWDASNSGFQRDIEKELEVLEHYFNYHKELKVQLITFSNEIHLKKDFNIKEGDWSGLKETLLNIDYDGGTQMGVLNLKDLVFDEFFLFSDGLSNFGNNEITVGNQAINVISSSQQADFSYLKYLCQTSGGQFLNVINMTAKDVANKLNYSAYQLISATYDDDEIGEVYPKTEFIKNGLQLAGKLKSKQTKIHLNFGFGNEIYDTKTIEIKSTESDYSGSIQRIWAQKKAAYLDVFHKKNEEELVKHAKEYGLVSRYTSLLVLDRLEDYVEHKIVPPTELQKEYFEAIAKRDKDKLAAKETHIDYVKELLKTRKEWWNTPILPKIKKQSQINESQLNVYADSSVVESDADEVPAMQLDRIEAEEPLDVGADGYSHDITSYAEFGSTSHATNSVSPSWTFGDGNHIPGLKNEGGADAKIKLEGWKSDASYIKELGKTKKEDAWKTYLKLKEIHSSPAFFIDVSYFFAQKDDLKTALRVLSNLAELELENHQTLRILAYRLIEMKEYELAILNLNEVVKMREEEPQSFRDLGLAYALNKQNQLAIENLYKVVTNSWDGRFPEIEMIALNELNTIISKNKNTLDTKFMDQDLLKSLPVDIRVVLNWDTDNCDMDLWVTDPNGEKCFYSHNKTQIGGYMTRDFTRGYGPEVFLLKKAVKGKYKIQANYYGTSSQKLLGPVTIKMHFYTNYGRANQKREEVILRLKSTKEVVDIANIEF